MDFRRITPTQLGRGSVAVTPLFSLFYTVPASTRTIIKAIDVCNTTATSLTVTVYLVPAGSTPNASNIIIPPMQIIPFGSLQWSGTQIINTGDTIQATSSAAGATLHTSGGTAV